MQKYARLDAPIIVVLRDVRHPEPSSSWLRWQIQQKGIQLKSIKPLKECPKHGQG